MKNKIGCELMVLKETIPYGDAAAVAAVEAAGLSFATGKDIEYIEALTADHTASGEVKTLTAGENVEFGDLCYFKSDSKMWKTDADAEATTKGMIGLALATIAADATGKFLLIGYARDDTWAWTIGGLIYVSLTAGALTQTAPSATGDIVRIVGYATHADRMRFCPDDTYIEIV